MSKQQAKSLRAQTAITNATIECLFKRGYGETTLVRVASQAGFSKGALQHHYPNKEDLIAATADVLLRRPFAKNVDKVTPASVEQAITSSWHKMTNTTGYRALLEILIAARTDKKLEVRISDQLHHWNHAMDQQAVDNYRSIAGDDKDVVALMTMSRSLMRGLVIQDRYADDPSENDQHIARWAAFIGTQLTLR